MTRDHEDLLRGELRGAASRAPSGLGVDDAEVLARGRRAVVRRRVLTIAGAAVATLAVAATIGLLATRDGDTDTLPALPTRSVSPTPDVTPTTTPSASVTESVSPSATPAGDGWSDPVSIAGRTYRVRLLPSSASRNFDLELQAGGSTVFTPEAVYNTEGRWGVDEGEPRVAYYLGGASLVDLVSVKGAPVDDEVIGHVPVPTPPGNDVAGEPYVDLVVTVFRTSAPSTMAAAGPDGWVVRFANGGLWDLGKE